MRLPKVSIALFYFLFSMSVHAASCIVGTTSVNFGSYDVFSTTDLDTSGTITVTCNPINTPYTIALEKGNTGNVTNRRMEQNGGSDKLQYNLYIDATYSTIWGNGSGNSVVVSGTQSGQRIVYGRIPQGKNASVGLYSDSVMVTVSF